MIFISHRGNTHGTNPNRENHPDYIDEAITHGFVVEIDVWFLNYKWWLGHDKPQYNLSPQLFAYDTNNLIFHAKNPTALEKLMEYSDKHFFWHQEDEYTITSNGIVWVYPTKKLLSGSVCVLPEKGINGNINKCWGICSDFIENYKNL